MTGADNRVPFEIVRMGSRQISEHEPDTRYIITSDDFNLSSDGRKPAATIVTVNVSEAVRSRSRLNKLLMPMAR